MNPEQAKALDKWITDAPDPDFILDIYSKEIYQGEDYYVDQAGSKLAYESLVKYVKDYVGELTIPEVLEELQNLLLPSEFEELLKDWLVEEFRNQGIVKPFEMEQKKWEGN